MKAGVLRDGRVLAFEEGGTTIDRTEAPHVASLVGEKTRLSVMRDVGT